MTITALVERNIHLYQLHEHVLPGSDSSLADNGSPHVSETLEKGDAEIAHTEVQ